MSQTDNSEKGGEVDRQSVARVIEELYLSAYANEATVKDIDPGYEYAVQQLCFDLRAREPGLLDTDEEVEAAERAQQRFKQLVDDGEMPPLISA